LAETSTRNQLGAVPAGGLPVTADRAAGSSQSRPRRLAGTARRHWQFSLVMLAAVSLRAVVMVGYPPAMWFPDSYNYFYDAVSHVPDYVRPNGYPFFLFLSLTVHSVYPVVVAQALMGIVMGSGIYALLRRRGLPWWGAAVPAVPVFFDAFEVQLEHMITADTLFIFCVTLAVVIACWRDRPTVLAMAIAGLLIGYATITRSVGEPLLAVFIVGMLARRVGWQRLTALTVAGVVPVAAYMMWFHQSAGQYALTESSGAFLYSRVSAFADCSKMNSRMKLPADLAVLCDPAPVYQRWPSQEYLWANYEMPPHQYRETPLAAQFGENNTARFTPVANSLTQSFAERAILAQPVTYLHVAAKDVMHTFGWTRQPDPDNYYGNGTQFQFTSSPYQAPWWATRTPGDLQANAIDLALHHYFGGSTGQTKAVQPWAGFLENYQRWIYLRGSLLGVIMAIGAAGVVARWRRWGGIGLLPWLVGALLIVAPPVTAGFSYRYVLAAVPVACLAAGLAAVRGSMGAVG
jgi:hypothetical protein